MMTPVVNSAKPITEAKKMTSRVSSTPRWKAFEVRHHRERRDRLRHDRVREAREQIGDRRVAREDQEQTDHDRQDEADHLVARHRGSHAADREISAREQQAADVAGER